MKLQFTTLQSVHDYAYSRSNSEKPYGNKNVTEKAWANIAALSCDRSLKALKGFLMAEAPCVNSATRARIYRFVAERIVV